MLLLLLIAVTLNLSATVLLFIIIVSATAVIIACIFFIISSVISGLRIEGESGAGGEKRHSGSSLFSLGSISQGKACFYGAMTSWLVIWEEHFVCLKLRRGGEGECGGDKAER